MNLVWLIPAAPLAGALILFAGGRRLDRASGPLASLAVAAGFAASVVAWLGLLAHPAGDRSVRVHLFDWAAIGRFRVGADIGWDPLAAVMALTVTGVGLLIHVYSIGYMHGDPRVRRFFAYMNLFVFSMLTLVLSANLLWLYVGWELVGLCSYLLIGFWFERPKAATAAKKAFLVTRIGDTGLLIGIFLVFARTGTLDISGINALAARDGIAAGTATAIALLLFCGAVGKSGQLPLYVWLPDAMEGPTPVSALIHAATMVTAGVYLVVRMNPLFETAATASLVVAIVGAATAMFAAALALAEDDIKRVLAYSTISQLGYMFLAAGVGAYGFAIFHLVTHAFFKALLFLAAGSVMHALGDETSLERMGGLRKALPRTFALTLVGWAAITGVLPLAGFFSKDAIVAAVFAGGRTALFAVAVVTALLTAFYMSRLLFLAFAGPVRWSEGTHPHESGPVMLLPMAGLALLALIGGALNLPEGLPGAGLLSRFLAPVIRAEAHGEALGVTIVLWALATAGTLAAWYIYGGAPQRRLAVRSRLGPVNTVLRNKFYVDEIYATLIVAPARLVAAFLAYVVDLRIIDGAVNGVGTVVGKAAGSWRRVQSGFVRNYAVAVLLGGAGIVVWFALRAR